MSPFYNRVHWTHLRCEGSKGSEGGGGGFAADLRKGARLTPQVVSKGCVPTGETTHYDLCVAGAPSNHVRCASLLFRGRGERVLCSKSHKKRTPEGVLFFIPIRMRSSVRCPRCRRDRLHAVHQRRMLWLRSCSKRPVLRLSGVLRLRGLPRSERRRCYHIRNPAGR